MKALHRWYLTDGGVLCPPLGYLLSLALWFSKATCAQKGPSLILVAIVLSILSKPTSLCSPFQGSCLILLQSLSRLALGVFHTN